VLRVDIGGRAELARELDRVAAAELQMAVRVDAAAERQDVGEPLQLIVLDGGHAAVIMPARSRSPGPEAASSAAEQHADRRAGARDDLADRSGRAGHDAARDLPGLRHRLADRRTDLADVAADLLCRVLHGAAELLADLRDGAAGAARDLRDRAAHRR